jgi:hypothetical protein
MQIIGWIETSFIFNSLICCTGMCECRDGRQCVGWDDAGIPTKYKTAFKRVARMKSGEWLRSAWLDIPLRRIRAMPPLAILRGFA